MEARFVLNHEQVERVAGLLKERGCQLPHLCAINPNACGLPECWKKDLSRNAWREVSDPEGG